MNQKKTNTSIFKMCNKVNTLFSCEPFCFKFNPFPFLLFPSLSFVFSISAMRVEELAQSQSSKLDPGIALHSPMGNRIGKLCPCSASAGDISGRLENSIVFNSSICYVRPNYVTSFSDDDVTLMTFRSVSGATVSANSSSTPSTSLDDSLQHSTVLDSSASFESSGSFTSSTMVVPLMQHQHHHVHAPCGFSVRSNIEKGLSWGPIVGLQSPCDRVLKDGCSTENGSEPMKKLRRSLKKVLSRVFFSTLSLGERPILKKNDNANNARVSCSSTSLSGELRLHHGVEGGDDNNYFDDDGDGGGVCDLLMGCQNLHWAQGRAGEDRVHIVICENHGWVFVGIYDGFNGPDATDYLLNNMFYAVYDELKWLLCSTSTTTPDMAKSSSLLLDSDSMELEEKVLLSFKENGVVDGETENYPIGNEKLNLDCVSERVEGMNRRNSNEEVGMMWECEGGGEKSDIEKRVQAESDSAAFSHSDVLQALSEALRKTEDAFLKTSDEMIHHNPVLAMMGSCVLVMVMKGEDAYLMNVGDSRAVLATQAGNSLQLTTEHSTHVKEEVYRIRREHPDDPFAVTKGRVKGCLNVTRAFGAGFLKQPKQNNAVLETFKVSYIGESPYITCSPSLHHHRLSPNDKFLILSSDGLFQYFTNEEAVAKVESFITMFPDRDPAQLLIEEALSRAAKKAGLEFHELLDIPQGERRLYHDDISIVIISLEGKIWRSLV